MFAREWFIITFVLGFLALVILQVQQSHIREKKVLHKTSSTKLLTITFSGAVKNPGAHKCTPGSTVKEILKQVEVTSNADLRKIPFKKILLSDQTIEVPKKNKPKIQY